MTRDPPALPEAEFSGANPIPTKLEPLVETALYLAALASGAGGRARTVGAIEPRLSALTWNFAQRSLPFDRKDRHRHVPMSRST